MRILKSKNLLLAAGLLLFGTAAQAQYLRTSYFMEGTSALEKPRDFDPFGQAGLSPLATI